MNPASNTSDESARAALQAHLAEFAALRAEELEMIKWRDRLVFLSLGVSGALFSFALSGQPAASLRTSPRQALYLITPLCTAIGALWLVNAWRIHNISIYIRDVIGPRVNALIKRSSGTGAHELSEALAWEVSSERLMRKWIRRILEWLVLVTAFVFAGTLAQVLMISEVPGGTVSQKLHALDSPVLFVINCFMLAGCFGFFIDHLVSGRRYKAGPEIILQKRQ